MADDTTQESTTETADTAATAEQAGGNDLGDAGKKALAAERAAKKAAEKQLAELSKRLQEFEDRDKTEAQRLAERAEAVERERDEAQRELVRLRVITETGLPADLHEFVTGGDEDELRSKALRLMERERERGRADSRSVDVGLGPRQTAVGLNEDDPLLRDLKNHLGIR